MSEPQSAQKMVSTFVMEEKEEIDEPNLKELDLKVAKMDSMLKSVEHRIARHQARLAKLMDISEGEMIQQTLQRRQQKVTETS